MSEHIDSYPSVPPEEPKPVDISTLPPLPPSPEPTNEIIMETNVDTTEPTNELVDESTRLLNEVHETDKLIQEEQTQLEKEVLHNVEPVAEPKIDEFSRLLTEVHETKQTPLEKEIVKSVELVATEPKEASTKESDLVEDTKSLAALVSFFLSTNNTTDKSISISEDVKRVLFELLAVDGFLDEVETLLKDIVHDNKIDANDVPKLMILTVKLYEIGQTITLDVNVELCGKILKTLFELAVREKLIPLDSDVQELLNCLFGIVDTSIRLLATQTTGKKAKGLLQCLVKLLNGCK